MTATLQAIYEEGNILRLLSPLALPEGEQVEVTINSNILMEMERTAPDPIRAAEIMANIAGMPMEPGGEEFAGTEHDRILYGGPEGAR